MPFDRQELIDKLKLEIEVIEKGGYYPSVRQPRQLPRIFRDSVSCLNVGLEVKREPCLHCFLMEFVPPEHRDKEEPCHYIPLNEQGDTVASLSAAGDRDRLQDAVLQWLKTTVARLEAEAAAGG
ncbi:MAG: hypothetical protein K6U09_04240 [Acidobacteriia bacterium]|jgi:hypothetical protein|nr:hypothetical protein [Terriglobia bacterium]